jgi:hypothetical protein
LKGHSLGSWLHLWEEYLIDPDTLAATKPNMASAVGLMWATHQIG